MNKKALTKVLIIIAACIVMSFISPPEIFKATSGSIKFISEAPLETISASSEKINGLLNKSTREFAFFVMNSSFHGFNNILQQEHFNESYIESEKFPRSTFTGKIIEDIPFSTEGVYTVRAKGLLNIHGVEQERILKCNVIISKQNIKVTSSFSLVLEDHDISIPKIVFDKIAPVVQISIDVIMEQKKDEQ